jgi:hypothetical protein
MSGSSSSLSCKRQTIPTTRTQHQTTPDHPPRITFLHTLPRAITHHTNAVYQSMKVHIKNWSAVAQWRWNTGNTNHDQDDEGDVCGICRVPFEGCCPSCKMPGDDCPLSEFQFHSISFLCAFSCWSCVVHCALVTFSSTLISFPLKESRKVTTTNNHPPI